MPSATFNASLTFTPPASNTVSQAFSLELTYSAVSLGTIEVAKDSEAEITVPFGGATKAQGLVVRNNLDVDVGVKLNESAKPIYELAPGGMLMHWAPKPAGKTPLSSVTLKPVKKPTKPGTVEYVVLGA